MFDRYGSSNENDRHVRISRLKRPRKFSLFSLTFLSITFKFTSMASPVGHFPCHSMVAVLPSPALSCGCSGWAISPRPTARLLEHITRSECGSLRSFIIIKPFSWIKFELKSFLFCSSSWQAMEDSQVSAAGRATELWREVLQCGAFMAINTGKLS